MSYGNGINSPQGMKATKMLGSSTYNGQTSPYLIESGYANNIFTGDLVYINAAGYVASITDQSSSGTPNGAVALGVFNGCSFTTSIATNAVDPASPGRPYWPAGTVTLNNLPAVCDIIDDPNVLFDIQVTAGTNTAVQANVGQNANVVFNYDSGVTLGNTLNGQSTMALNQTQIGNEAIRTLRIVRFVPVPGNYAGQPYNNVEVLIQNHFYVSRPVGI